MGNSKSSKPLDFMTSPIPNILGIEDQTEGKLYKDDLSSDKIVKKVKDILRKVKDLKIPEAETFDKVKIKELGKICKALKFLKYVGPACSITLGVLEFMTGEDGTLNKQDVISIVKQEVYKELSEMILIQLKANIRSANQHVEDNDLKSAEILVLECLNIMYSFHKTGKFYQWSENLSNREKILFLYKFFLVNKFLLFTYEQLSTSEQKENRLKEFAEPVNKMKNFILEEREMALYIGELEITQLDKQITSFHYRAYLKIKDEFYDSLYEYCENFRLCDKHGYASSEKKKKFNEKKELAQQKINQWLSYKENLIAKWKEDLNSLEG